MDWWRNRGTAETEGFGKRSECGRISLVLMLCLKFIPGFNSIHTLTYPRTKENNVNSKDATKP